MSHLTIKTPTGTLALPSDFSLDIEEQNPMFNEKDMFSLPVQIPKEGNLHLLKNMFARKSPLRPISLEDTQMEVIAEGIPFRFGHISTSDGEEMTDSISVNMEGNSALRDLIGDMSLKDIQVDDDLVIGKKVSEIEVESKIKAVLRLGRSGPDHLDLDVETPIDGNKGEYISHFQPQALGFSKPMNINVSQAFPDMPYCNARVAYKRYGTEVDDDGNRTTSSEVEYGYYGPYEVLDAERQQSGVCWYVLYILRKAFEQLGVAYDDSELLAIEDMRRLCFFTTKCTYDEGDSAGFFSDSVNEDKMQRMNAWIAEQLQFAEGEQLDIDMNIGATDVGNEAIVQKLDIPDGSLVTRSQGRAKIIAPAQYAGRRLPYSEPIPEGHAVVVGDTPIRRSGGQIDIRFNVDWRITPPDETPIDIPAGTVVTVEYSDDCDFMAWVKSHQVLSCSCRLRYMLANSQNLPDENLTTVLESMEAQFGVRFVYDAEKHSVKACLLRNMYRDRQAPLKFVGTIIEMNKIAEKIKGVKMGYGSESDDKEQRDNLRDMVKDYDLDYDYIDYPLPLDAGGTKGMTGVVKASETIVGEKQYSKCLAAGATNTDNVCYIDSTTGNAYRIKINSEYTSVKDMKPAWFEAGAYVGVRLGDCSDEDCIETFSSSFIPVPLNDVNADRVRMAADNSEDQKNKDNQPLLCAYVDEDMEHPYLPQYLDYPFDKMTFIDVTVRCKLTLHEAYDTSGSDDGNSPLQSVDWGLTIGIMRGAGNDATTQIYDDDYDGFGTAKYAQVVGTYALTADCMDAMGNYYDYNGSDAGLGGGERFSLKPRAYKTPSWAPDGQYVTTAQQVVYLFTPDEYDDQTGEIVKYNKTRGWVDRFLMEHASAILNRRKFLVRATTTVAFLADLPRHWNRRFDILGEIGYINKVNYKLSAEKGLEDVEIEFYAL
jgi:hypothetical protein